MAFCVAGAACKTLFTLHILGVVAFLGGLAFATWWKLGADRSRDVAFAARVHRRLRDMDAHFIGPGALVTFAAGYAMIRFFGSRIAENPFALWGLIFMFLALGLWFFVMRTQGEALAREADALAKSGKPFSSEYARRSVTWLGAAAGAVLLVVLVALMMIFKWPTELWPF